MLNFITKHRNTYIFVGLFIIATMASSSNCFSQTRFNKIIDCEHQAMNVLVNVLPVEHGYLLAVGSGNVEGYGDNRCTMLVKIDEEGNLLYKNFVCDSTYDVYEGRFSSGIIHCTNNMTYKCILEARWNKMILCEFDNSLECISRQDTIFDIPHKILDVHYDNDNIYIVGQIYENSKHCGYIEKRDLFGGFLNRTVPLGFDIESGYQVIIKKDENDKILIYGNISNNNQKLYSLIKLDTSLNIIMQKVYGRNNWDNGINPFMVSSPDSCYVMSGVYPVCYANRFQEETSVAACIRKIDDDGNLLWEKIIKNYNIYTGIASKESAYDLYVDGEGYIYVVGLSSNCDGYAGILLKLTPDGEIAYRRNYLPTGGHNGWMAYLNSVKPTPDGGLIMGGYTYSDFYGTDFDGYYQQPWLVKTDIDGLDGLCYTELPELYLDVFIPDTVCNLDTIDCVVNISGPSAPYTLEFSTGQTIENIYYPDVFVPREIGIDTVFTGERMYQYTETITEATLKDTDTAVENIIAKHYNIATPTLPGEQQLAITLTDFYGNTKTIYKDIYVNTCHEVEVDENENVVLSVYPNPARESITIAGENIAEIEICNLLGEVVYEMQQCNGNNVISTENMPAGSYFVRVSMADGKIVTKKIVVVK